MKKIFLATALICLSASAFGQQQCPTHDQLSGALNAEEHQEFVVAAGLTNTGHLIEIYINEDTGAFTITLTNTNKMSCIAISGEWLHIKSDKQRVQDAIEKLPQY